MYYNVITFVIIVILIIHIDGRIPSISCIPSITLVPNIQVFPVTLVSLLSPLLSEGIHSIRELESLAVNLSRFPGTTFHVLSVCDTRQKSVQCTIQQQGISWYNIFREHSEFFSFWLLLVIEWTDTVVFYHCHIQIWLPSSCSTLIFLESSFLFLPCSILRGLEAFSRTIC